MTGDVWTDRDIFLPYDPPGWKRRRRLRLFGRREHCIPGRCWKLNRRDRLAWRLFSWVANSSHSSVVWWTFRATRKAQSTTWRSDGGSHSMVQLPPRETEETINDS